MCIFCNANEDGTRHDLHQVCSFDVRKKIREIVGKSDNSEWKVRLQPLNPDDARAIDIKYHRVCYITASRRFSNPSNDSDMEQVESSCYFEKIVSADIEFISLLKTTLAEKNIL